MQNFVNTKTKWLIQLILFSFFLFFSGWLAVKLGIDLSWDVANYHYYNPYAFLNHREQMDYWPASFMHAYFIPSSDFLAYYLINHFSPMKVVWILGVLHGLNICLAYLIAYHFLTFKNHYYNILFAAFLAVMGICSALVLPSLGGLSNDNIISIFVLTAILIQLWDAKPRTGSTHLHCHLSADWDPVLIIISGVLLGIAIGMKLTAGVFLIGSLAGIFFSSTPFTRRLKYLLLLSLSTLASYLLTSSYWLIHLWKQYQNPLFPFYNAIFHSPFHPATNIKFTTFLPHSLTEYLLYPVYFSWLGTIGDHVFRDLRFATVFILFIVYGLHYLWKKYFRHRVPVINPAEKWLFIFFLFSYLAWLYLFGVVRYLTPLAILSPLMIFLLARQLFQNTIYLAASLICIFYFIILSTLSPTIVRSNIYSSTYFDVKMPQLVNQTPQAMVLVAYSAYALTNQPKPQNYLIPFFPHAWHFVGIPFNDTTQIGYVGREQQDIAKIIENYQGTFFLLSSQLSMPELYRAAKQFGLTANGDCQTIKSSRQWISNSVTLLCPVKKMLLAFDNASLKYS